MVLRFTERNNAGVDPEVIVDDLPETLPAAPGFNANGSIHFGPDGFLYVSLGDYDTPPLVQDLSTAEGKMLRVDKEDGSPAEDNPFADDPVGINGLAWPGRRSNHDRCGLWTERLVAAI